jgi:hypothetical protein
MASSTSGATQVVALLSKYIGGSLIPKVTYYFAAEIQSSRNEGVD